MNAAARSVAKNHLFCSLRVSGEIAPYFKGYGSKDVKSLISRVSVPKSEEKGVEGLLDPSKFSDLDENDPGSIERIMKKLGGEFGEGIEESMEGVPHEPRSTPEKGF